MVSWGKGIKEKNWTSWSRQSRNLPILNTSSWSKRHWSDLPLPDGESARLLREPMDSWGWEKLSPVDLISCWTERAPDWTKGSKTILANIFLNGQIKAERAGKIINLHSHWTGYWVWLISEVILDVSAEFRWTTDWELIRLLSWFCARLWFVSLLQGCGLFCVNEGTGEWGVTLLEDSWSPLLSGESILSGQEK